MDQIKMSLPRNFFIHKHLFCAIHKIKAHPQNKLHSQPEQMVPALNIKPRNGEGRIHTNDSPNYTKQNVWTAAYTSKTTDRVLELSYETRWVLFSCYKELILNIYLSS